MALDTVSNLIFTGPLTWTTDGACVGQTNPSSSPQLGSVPRPACYTKARARAVCRSCPVLEPCRDWAREHREYGFWGGWETEEERATARYRVDMPVGRVARYPKGAGEPVKPRRSRQLA